jgi:hypothetical protein
LRDLSAQYEREQKQQVEQLEGQVRLLVEDYGELAATLLRRWR